MNSKKNSKCIVVSNKVLIFAVLKDKRINYIIKHLKIIVMIEKGSTNKKSTSFLHLLTQNIWLVLIKALSLSYQNKR